ncbi:uncharacterized protein G2W53_039764 [Senna tora]|uniref:Uncharacterized protein n=1 Tax=Senna tora TaxID=362788 RepID=A0A834W3U7_9FABA|nr:uncharacterized protein G2W53_039764 [Senna tora]
MKPNRARGFLFGRFKRLLWLSGSGGRWPEVSPWWLLVEPWREEIKMKKIKRERGGT